MNWLKKIFFKGSRFHEQGIEQMISVHDRKEGIFHYEYFVCCK